MDRYSVGVFAGDTEVISLPMTHGAGGTNVLLSEVSALTLTLTDRKSAGIVNGRNGQNVLNVSNVTVIDGKVEWAIQPADTAFVDAASIAEIHCALFTLTLTDGQVRTAEIAIHSRKRC